MARMAHYDAIKALVILKREQQGKAQALDMHPPKLIKLIGRASNPHYSTGRNHSASLEEGSGPSLARRLKWRHHPGGARY